MKRTCFHAATSLLLLGVCSITSAAPRPLTIVCFGDSTTALRSTVKAVYAQRLQQHFDTNGISAKVINAGVGGSHTGHLADNARHNRQHALDRFDQSVRAHKPDVVIVQFGWNDSWVDSDDESQESRISVAAYRSNLTRIVRQLDRDGAFVFLMTPNRPHRAMEKWRVQRTQKYVDAVREIARREPVSLIDIWKQNEKYNQAEGQSIDDLLLDSVHPNDRGHKLVSDLILQRLGGIYMEDETDARYWSLAGFGHAPGFRVRDSRWKETAEMHLPKPVDETSLEGQGVNNVVVLKRTVGAGDFEVRAKLRMDQQKKCAAGFMLDNHFFGFEGARETVFVNGPKFGGVKLLMPAPDVFERESWVDFRAIRQGRILQFKINGKTVYESDFGTGPVKRLAFTPHRSTMKISWLRLYGSTLPSPAPMPRGYTIPTIDLSSHSERQTIVDREPGQYLGHPTTVLLDDQKTMLCVYPKGHGRGEIVFKRSRDGGKTWSERLPTPKNWATSQEVPTLFKVQDANGKRRIVMFSGLYPIRMAISEDNGVNWSELKPIGDFGGIVAMGCLFGDRNKPGYYSALFHDDGRFLKGGKKKSDGTPLVPRGKFFVYQTDSADGGLTWSDPRIIARHETAHLCEPGVIRSPDGKQLAVLLRENSRRHNSFVIFSNDEGKTWSTPRELPASLTGDRHTAVYSPDGRLFVSFRDTTHVSPTAGDWVAWVGRYHDIVEGNEGQYRVRLMDNKKSKDCAYPGVEILPDGTIVTTTYGHWQAGEAPYIVSVRLKLSELDALAKK